MLAWIGKILAGSFVQSEIKQIKLDMENASTQVQGIMDLKKEFYTYADGILAEGQAMSKDKLDAWWVQKRAELKTWAGG